LDDSITRGGGELLVALDDGAGLVAVQARHQDVAEDQVGLAVAHLGQGVEAVLGQRHLMAALLEKISALRRMVLLSSMTRTFMDPVEFKRFSWSDIRTTPGVPWPQRDTMAEPPAGCAGVRSMRRHGRPRHVV
jgi:hypothetical protein